MELHWLFRILSVPETNTLALSDRESQIIKLVFGGVAI